MAKKYKGKDGECLVVDNDTYDEPTIVWYFPEDEGNLGAHLGEFANEDNHGPEDFCTQTIEKIAKGMLDADTWYDGVYRFSSVAKAKAFIKVLNEALLNTEQANWPPWAIQAKAEGWDPPEGWTPKK